MFALYFNSLTGRREFVATVDNIGRADGLARLLSKSDPREVVIVDNSPLGDTVVVGLYQLGEKVCDQQNMPAELSARFSAEKMQSHQESR
ncbi:MAG: hypothetical protein AB7E79_12600 [Rhodospirillaceae bacterium]